MKNKEKCSGDMVESYHFPNLVLITGLVSEKTCFIEDRRPPMTDSRPTTLPPLIQSSRAKKSCPVPTQPVAHLLGMQQFKISTLVWYERSFHC